MHARLTEARIRPGTLDAVTSIYWQSIIPAAREQRGFQGAFLLTDPDTSHVVSITLWNTEADALATEETGFLRDQFAKLGGLLAEPARPHLYAVSTGSPTVPGGSGRSSGEARVGA